LKQPCKGNEFVVITILLGLKIIVLWRSCWLFYWRTRE